MLHEDSPRFAEAESRGFLLDEGYERVVGSGRPAATYREGQRYLDFSNPALRAWWWAAHRELMRQGVAGWWLDGGEGPPAAARLQAGDGRRLHNIYDRLRHQAFAEGEAADRPGQRVFLLCRSGAAGMQRYGASCWSGDINNDFATLEAQIPLGLNTGLSGVPYWGTDIGGFFHPIPETGELYARWFQLGAFSPIFRSHGWVWREHVPWAHGPEVEAICRRYAELRYRLLPYTYSLAWQAHTLGLPLMRPLVLNYPDDPRVWSLGHQFLWGDDLLVAPVTREGATAWPVYLPAGRWHDFWTGVRYEGPGGVTLPAPLDRLPLLVRAGAILPLGPVVQHTGERPLDEVTLLDLPAERRRDVAVRAVRGRRTVERLPARAPRPDRDRVRGLRGRRDGPDRGAGGRPVRRATGAALPPQASGGRADLGGRGRARRALPAGWARPRRPGLVGRRRGIHSRAAPRPARRRRDRPDYDLKYQVSVWAMCGLSLTALFQRRSGMLPMLFLITRTPWEAGEFETTGMIHSSSSAIFQISLASCVRS